MDTLRRRRWWQGPRRIAGFLRRARRAEPARWIHLAAVLLGLALGLLAEWWFGWPWWVFALGVPLVVWGIVLATAVPWFRLWGWKAARAEMFGGDELRARHERLARLVAAGRVTAYGLSAEMGGRRRVRGWGTERNRVTSVTLIHGDPVAGPYVEVTFDARPFGDPALRLVSLARDGGPVAAPDGATRWEPCPIRVDGAEVTFQRARWGRRWVAHAVVGDGAVMLDVFDFPAAAVSLVRLDDLASYFPA
ncbi:MAG: hypothetical protein PVI35_04470 [Acidimicrobiia bacterium]